MREKNEAGVERDRGGVAGPMVLYMLTGYTSSLSLPYSIRSFVTDIMLCDSVYSC